LRVRRDSTGKVIVWSLVRPNAGESCRWESVDGRWVALTIGSADELGRVIVTSSDGRREWVETYEDALATAKSWREP
jgi:hypothetical protein